MTLNDDVTPTTDITILYVDGEATQPIIWDKNIASLTGTLNIAGRAIRAQCPDIHKLLTSNIVEERGITYIDNPAKIDLLENPELKVTAGTLTAPCPPTPKLQAVVNAVLARRSKSRQQDPQPAQRADWQRG